MKFAVSHGLDVMFVTEDTTRCDPETIQRMYTAAINCGAKAIVICDTVGHATPMGVVALIQFVMNEVVMPSGENIRVESVRPLRSRLGWANFRARSSRALKLFMLPPAELASAWVVRRSDQMLVNLKLLGVEPWASQDLTKLKEYCEVVSRATGVPIPKNFTPSWATTLSAPEPAFTRQR